MFWLLSASPLEPGVLVEQVRDRRSGGYVGFEGWVREENEGREVERLLYEAYAPLCEKEAKRILAEAKNAFFVAKTALAHRVGELRVGELAVWVGVSAKHRGPAFDACQYIIDAVKTRLPVWKKEYYQDGTSLWVSCAHEH